MEAAPAQPAVTIASMMPEAAERPERGAPHDSDPATLVLHGLRVKAFPDTDVLAAAVGLPVDEVALALVGFAEDGLVRRVEGHLTGWTLTTTGREQGERLLARELDASGGRAAVTDAYRRFAALNGELLAVCTAWQLRDDVVNDHTDVAYDRQVVLRLVALHDLVRPVVVDLRQVLSRFAGYSNRLRTAVERVAAGESEWFTKPVIDSYHSVWFELHEDLLATLGLERARETA